MHPSKKPRVFYGYWIVAVGFLCLFIWSGAGWYCFSLFVKPLEADFGWGRGEIMVGFTILFLVIGVAAPFIGRVVDRYGARTVIVVGTVVLGLGFVLLSLMNDLWVFYLSYVIIGLGMAAMGLVPTSTVVSNWFKKRRGAAIGIMSTGQGAGGFILSPVVGGYLIPNFGWRTSYLVLAVLIWVLIIPLALLVLKTKPSDMGLYPDGIESPETDAPVEAIPSAVEGLTLRMALATPVFWLIFASFFLSLVSQNGIIMNQVPHLEDIGFPVATAATALGTVGLMSAIGKFGFGWLCDRMPARYVWCIGLGLQLVGITIIMNVGPASPVILVWLYAISMGLGGGGWLPAMSILASTTFGLVAYGAVFGAISLSQGLGAAIGPLAAGYMYDIMNTYHWFFIACLVSVTLAIPVILATRRPKSSSSGVY